MDRLHISGVFCYQVTFIQALQLLSIVFNQTDTIRICVQ